MTGRARRPPDAVVVAAAGVLGVAGLAGCTAGGAAPSPTSSTTTSRSAEYTRAFRIGQEAYTYGLPLLTTEATFRTMTSVSVPQGAYGPVNRVNSVRTPNTASSTAVVAPGATSLSSIAWLDLRDGPQVLHVPKVTGRAFVLAFIDPYTENLVNLGSASATEPGDYVIVAPSQASVPIPSGTTRLAVDYTRIWIIGSTQLKGPGDIPAVNAIQDQYTLTPLSAFGAPARPSPSPSASTSGTASPSPSQTITRSTVPTGLGFFDALGEQLAAFPPPSRDAAALETFAEVGIGPGLAPSRDDALSADTLAGLTDAVESGPALVKQQTESIFAAGFDEHHGYLLGGFGQYGTDYPLRAVISQIGLGAFVPHQAIYAMTWTDHDRAALDGSSAYVLHLAEPPPTDEGWSLTVYGLDGALVPNAANRYALTNASALTRNADGSVDIHLQPAAPSDPAAAKNWLPTPPGAGFEVTWRLFAPQPAQIDAILGGTGWQPPEIDTAQAASPSPS